MQMAQALRGLPGRSSTGHDFAAIHAAADFSLILDAAGIVRNVAFPGVELARDMPGSVGWLGQPWFEVIAPDSCKAAAALLAEASATGPAAWRTVVHRPAGQVDVPVLCTSLRLADGAVLVLGRDLLALDISRLALAEDVPAVIAYVAARQARGTEAEALCLDLLAPAARRMGELWGEDRCDFMAVTEGVWRLRQALRTIDLAATSKLVPDPVMRGPAGRPEHRHRVLLAPVHGEQHCFGIEMVAAFFRWDGWDVRGGALLSEDPAAVVARERFDVVGLSLAAADDLPALTAAIQAIRKASCNPGIVVLVGGQAFVQRPDLALEVGADATATDARQAVLLAKALLRTAETPVMRSRPDRRSGLSRQAMAGAATR